MTSLRRIHLKISSLLWFSQVERSRDHITIKQDYLFIIENSNGNKILNFEYARN